MTQIITWDSIRVLTLHQPWASFASAQFDFLKEWETRDPKANWFNYRGWILIQAAVKELPGTWEAFQLHCKRLKVVVPLPQDFCFQKLPRGKLLSLVKITDSQVMTTALIQQQTPLELAMGDWQIGRRAIRLEQAQPLLEPIPYTNGQGLQRLRDEDGRVKQAIAVQLPHISFQFDQAQPVQPVLFGASP